jgi:hypothetical protein
MGRLETNNDLLSLKVTYCIENSRNALCTKPMPWQYYFIISNEYDRLWLIPSQAPNMMASINQLKSSELYPSVNHVSCLAHALHNVCEAVRKDNVKVDEFIDSIKSILSQSTFRKSLFRKVTKIAYLTLNMLNVLSILNIHTNHFFNCLFNI